MIHPTSPGDTAPTLKTRILMPALAVALMAGTAAKMIGESGFGNDKRSRATLGPRSIHQQTAQLSENDRTVLPGYAHGYNTSVDKVPADQTNPPPKQFTDLDETRLEGHRGAVPHDRRTRTSVYRPRATKPWNGRDSARSRATPKRTTPNRVT